MTTWPTGEHASHYATMASSLTKLAPNNSHNIPDIVWKVKETTFKKLKKLLNNIIVIVYKSLTGVGSQEEPPY